MKKVLLVAGLIFLIAATSIAQVTVSGAIAGNGTYTSLTNTGGAFPAINGSAQTGAGILITITSDVTTETGLYGLNEGAWSSVVIQPSGARTLSGTVAGKALLLLNGADHVTINGLNDGVHSLTVSNTSTAATAGTSTIKFIGDASYNTITNCSVLGSATVPVATAGGNIFFSTGTITGNDNNTISFCNIGPAGSNCPSTGVFGSGSTTSETIANSSITISYCSIYDFFLAAGCAGVYAITGNTEWSITNNKIYQTAPRTMTEYMFGIFIENSVYGNNIQVTGNKIGFSGNPATGALTLNGTTPGFQGIYLKASPNAASTCNINNDTIANISITSTARSFYGIYNATGTGSNTLNINNNIVSNIDILTTTATIAGIYAGEAYQLNCNFNRIQDISRNTGGMFYGIQYNSPNSVTIHGDTIRNLASTSPSSVSAFYGIFSSGSASTETLTGNLIYNFTSASTGSQPVIGWYNNTNSGTKLIQSNKIHHFTSGGGATMHGIRLASGTNCEISGNEVYAFDGALKVYGIAIAAGSANQVFKNRIYDLSSAKADPLVYGISVEGGATNNIFNNFISDLRTPIANADLPVAGIYLKGGTINNVFYNTVYLDAASTGIHFGSAALYTDDTPTLDMRDNVLVNVSTPNGMGVTAAYRRESAILTTYSANSNANAFYAGATEDPAHAVYFDGATTYNMAGFKTLVGPSRDAVSFRELPPFFNTAIRPYDLHMQPTTPTNCLGGGIAITSPIVITTDYDGDVRATPPCVGADEFVAVAATVWTGSVSTDWATPGNWSPNQVPGASTYVVIPAASIVNFPVVNESLATPANCNNLMVSAGASVSVNAGKALSVNGTLTNNSGAAGIVLLSDAPGTAAGSFIFNTAGVQGSIQRYISAWGDVSHGWHFLSSPVTSMAIQPGFVPDPPGSAQDFYAWDEVNGWWFNSKDLGLAWVPEFDASFIPGKGYLVAYGSSGARTFSGVMNVANISRWGLTFTPGPYTGDITPGWNLLGNPFTSAIVWNTAGWSLLNIAAVAKIWVEANAAYTDVAAGEIIPATQGFMVNVTAGTGSLIIPATARTHSPQNWYKSTEKSCIKLVVRNPGAQTAQESTVVFDNEATPGFDPAFDCRFLPGYAPYFYSVEGTDKLSTNVLPALNGHTTVPFSFIKTEGTDYYIEATKIEHIPGQVYLTDLKLNITQNLGENPVYSFTAAPGDDPARFLLSFSHAGVGAITGNNQEIYTWQNNLCIVNPGRARLEVYSLAGQQLLAEDIDSPGLYKTTLHVPSAYYVVRLVTGTKVVVRKVLIMG